MYQLWKQDRSAVHSSWDIYFQNAERGLFAFVDPNSLDPTQRIAIAESSKSSNESVNLIHMIRAYQALVYFYFY